MCTTLPNGVQRVPRRHRCGRVAGSCTLEPFTDADQCSAKVPPHRPGDGNDPPRAAACGRRQPFPHPALAVDRRDPRRMVRVPTIEIRQIDHSRLLSSLTRGVRACSEREHHGRRRHRAHRTVYASWGRNCRGAWMGRSRMPRSDEVMAPYVWAGTIRMASRTRKAAGDQIRPLRMPRAAASARPSTPSLAKM